MLVKRDNPLNESERKMHNDLQIMRSNLKEFNSQINENKTILDRNVLANTKIDSQTAAVSKPSNNFDEQDMTQIRYFLKNEYDMIFFFY